jgi:hypothetical protein
MGWGKYENKIWHLETDDGDFDKRRWHQKRERAFFCPGWSGE